MYFFMKKNVPGTNDALHWHTPFPIPAYGASLNSSTPGANKDENLDLRSKEIMLKLNTEGT